MIDIGKILKRSWHILWNYKMLWIFAIVLSIAVGGSAGGGGGGGGSGSGPTNGLRVSPETNGWPTCTTKSCTWFQETFRPLVVMAPETVRTLIVIGIVLAVLLLVLLAAMAFARYISETAIIRMVDEYERTGTKVGFRQGFRYGWSISAWRFFMIDVLVHLPLLVIGLLIALMGGIIYLTATHWHGAALAFVIIASVGSIFLIIFLAILIGAVLNLVRQFALRICAIEQVGVIESLRRAFQLAWKQWKNVGLMWLVMIGLGFAYGLAGLLAFILLIPIMILILILSIAAGVVAAALPALLAFWITSLLAPGPFPWIVAALVGIPFFVIVASLPWNLIGGWWELYKSNVWTLTYRELKVMPNHNGELPAAAQA